MSLYTELWARIGDIGKDIGIILKKTNATALAAITDGCSIYRTGKDANGVFVTVTYKRLDATIAKTSVLSLPDGSNRYTRRTETFYDTNGTTVLVTRVFQLNYDGAGALFEEVLQS